MLMTEIAGEPIVILKADSEDAKALREQYEDSTAGCHMNKQQWITLHPGGTLPGGLVDDLVTQSYRLVIQNLPRSKQPGGAPDERGPPSEGQDSSGAPHSRSTSPRSSR